MKKTIIVLTILLGVIIVLFIFFKDYIPGTSSNKKQNQTTDVTVNQDTNNSTDTSSTGTNNPTDTNTNKTNKKQSQINQTISGQVVTNPTNTNNKNNTSSENTILINKDTKISSTTPQSPQIQNQKQSDGNQKDVVFALSKQLSKTNLHFFGTVIVYPYALQGWSDDYMGGFALLKHTESGVWFLLNTGGGNIDYETLTKLNVNPFTAMRLIEGLNNQ